MASILIFKSMNMCSTDTAMLSCPAMALVSMHAVPLVTAAMQQNRCRVGCNCWSFAIAIELLRDIERSRMVCRYLPMSDKFKGTRICLPFLASVLTVMHAKCSLLHGILTRVSCLL